MQRKVTIRGIQSSVALLPPQVVPSISSTAQAKGEDVEVQWMSDQKQVLGIRFGDNDELILRSRHGPITLPRNLVPYDLDHGKGYLDPSYTVNDIVALVFGGVWAFLLLLVLFYPMVKPTKKINF